MENKTICKIGLGAGLSGFMFALAFSVFQLLQVLQVVGFPTDEIMIYGSSLGIVIPFILAILTLHYITPEGKRFWSHAALIFTVMYAVFVSANYVVQLVTVIPGKLNGHMTK
jgi:O-antigen ligase